MTTWRVHHVMTSKVITAPHDASVAEIVALLTERQITAVPIVDRFDVVLGIVSWTDLRRKIDLAAPDDETPVGWWRRRLPAQVEWPRGTAVEVMNAPALTIGADTSLPAAARVMYRRGVGRLLVVDSDSRLRGIVTRSDLLKVHARLDAVIREEVMRQVVGRTPQIRPGTVQTTVDDGVVTLHRAYHPQDDRRRRGEADRDGPRRHRRRRPAHVRRRRHRHGRTRGDRASPVPRFADRPAAGPVPPRATGGPAADHDQSVTSYGTGRGPTSGRALVVADDRQTTRRKFAVADRSRPAPPQR
ncbi:hypothetical protein DMB66_09465 [Actinoplanes sp. ATCC 53533]|nr:hypothetical protein DMB66_09465 [Actinoplanes sp. ATCC 53533]